MIRMTPMALAVQRTAEVLPEAESTLPGQIAAALLFLVAVGAFLWAAYGPARGWVMAAGALAALGGLALCHAQGRLPLWAILVLALGLGLLAVELCVPGFGLWGVAGTLAVGVGLYQALCQPWVFAVMVALAAGLLAGGSSLLRRRYGQAHAARWVTLEHRQCREAGYTAAPEVNGVEVGASGWTLTALRPQGKVKIGAQRYEAVSRSGWLDPCTAVRVCAVTDTHLEVEQDHEA